MRILARLVLNRHRSVEINGRHIDPHSYTWTWEKVGEKEKVGGESG